MPVATARALTMGLVGGFMAILFYTQGLPVWAAFIAWACFVEAGGDSAALKKAIAGNAYGALLGWGALLVVRFVEVPADTWLWMPRTGLALVVALAVLGLTANMKGIGSIPAALYGFAAVLGVNMAATDVVWTSGQRLVGLRLYNPLFATVLSMVGGALSGFLASKLAERLSRT